MLDDVERFAGARVLVTGGASGIGLAVARRFAAEGAWVAVADRDHQALSAARNDGLSGEWILLDQTSEESVDSMTATLLDNGGVDVVCANAAVHPGRTLLEELTVESWDATHRVNLRGTMLVARAAARLIRARSANDRAVAGGGAVVFTSSVAGFRPVAGDARYASSKAGLQALARTVALELAPEGIRVATVLPGFALTPLLMERNGDELDTLAAAVPLGRIGRAEEVAAVIAFLASADASYVTATEIIVDGGLAARGPL